MCSPLSTDHTENLRALDSYTKHFIQLSTLDKYLTVYTFWCTFSQCAFIADLILLCVTTYIHVYLSINLHNIQHLHIYTAAQCLIGHSEDLAQIHTSIDVVGKKELGAWNLNILFLFLSSQPCMSMIYSPYSYFLTFEDCPVLSSGSVHIQLLLRDSIKTVVVQAFLHFSSISD